MLNKNSIRYLIALAIGLSLLTFRLVFTGIMPKPGEDEMMALIKKQLSFGTRSLGSDAHDKMVDFLIAEATAMSEEIKIQDWTDSNIKLTNIIGRFDPSNDRRIILGTHYDTKIGIPGANDSASGVAVLLELMKILKNSPTPPKIGIDFVFFDGEEGFVDEGVENPNWSPLGSTYFAEHLKDLYSGRLPINGIVVDMVCDSDLQLYQDQASLSSAPDLVKQIWQIGQAIDPLAFISLTKHNIIDDHTPLNRIGIPSIDIIDFDYPYWHTTKDTADKCSAKSLETVTQTLLDYIYSI